MDEGAADRLGVWASAPEGPPHARLHGPADDPLPLPVAADEQRHVGRPTGKTLPR